MQSVTQYRSPFSAATTFVVLALLQSTAHADEQKQDDDHIILGLGAGYAPAYEGADKYRVLPLPPFDIKWGPLFANLRNGIGINIIDTEHVTLGTSINFLPGYRAEDAPRGIGTLSIGAGARAFVSLKGGGFIATIGGTKDVAGGTKGAVGDVSLSYPIVVTPRFMVIPTLGATYADKKYNNRYFGVSAEQSLASGLPQFAPGAGLKDASALLSANYRLTERFMLGVSVGATTLLNTDKNSPIVVHRNAQPSGFLSLSYRFAP